MDSSVIEYPGVQLSWRRILAIAQDQPDPIVAKSALLSDDTNDEEHPPPQEQATFNRMQCMNKALQNIYTITSQDQGYIAFMVTMATELQHKCPISMAFLKHVIDFSEIPTQQTLQHVTMALLDKLSSKQTTAAVNATIIWSMLAQKFAGSLAESIWTDALGDLLIQCLYDDNNIYSLLALESFALTGSLKRLLQAQCGIARALQQVLGTVDQNLLRLLQQSPLLPSFESIKSTTTTADSPNLTLVSIKHHVRIYQELKSAFKSCRSKLSKKRKSSRESKQWGYYKVLGDDTITPDQIMAKTRQEDITAFLDLRKLHFCLEWSLTHVFGKNDLDSSPPDQQTYLQPIDLNSHCKLSKDRLEVRNDTFFFESVRATTGVPTHTGGRWYYEVLLLTDGIMQIGWGTKKCLLSSQDGSGIGDDVHGFAFDTHRCAVWAAGELHSSSSSSTTSTFGGCKAGDVLGCLLDLDKDYCTFFINGQDHGLSIDVTKTAMALYPTISLTGHQHVVANFGSQAWYHSVEGAQAVTDAAPPRCHTTVEIKQDDVTEINDDGPLCNICYAEPINVKLLPCEHDGIGETCAHTLASCLLK
ncbi:concanavalin A-like lectin/glucanase domain-containing protein [Mucor lusitanicus]|uniref:B30.2/SPRY domain-containing protein n=2 Tax=Mucor circinelloides f. lusitanicus TaxID=29924 RepID=A0A162QZL6_MUCCL|nr:concanavalin A-like lectin/glucanase domain-containing protein [Mucor lusitanicus]OAD06930.1 hypothetical protein MUCCIDRAFT_160546 [Mucor lusitanicus CBS 277.49]